MMEDNHAPPADAVDLVWKRINAIALQPRPKPEATYRLQFHAGFTFNDAARITPYLRELGVSHCYASPYLRAKAGSTHGYDIIDHSTLNPEIGSEADYDAWVASLQQANLGQIADIVPNHMGIATNENVWWNDVLENGPASQFGRYFDIAWRSSPRAEMQDRVLLPVLGQPYGDVLEAAQLRLSFDGGAFSISYFDRHFPIAAPSYGAILAHRLPDLASTLGPESKELLEYQSILTAVRNLPARNQTETQKVAERARETEVIKRRLATLAGESSSVRAFIDENVAQFNGKQEAGDRYALLDNLLEQQCYRLAYWRVAPDEINYRRFFDINDLAALSMERPEVFEAAHSLILRLLAAGKIDGVRIDHPDGLFDPAQYFLRLQESFVLACARHLVESHEEFRGLDWAQLEAPLRERIRAALQQRDAWPLYMVAEKILSPNESLADDWAVHGTSGYDFINMVNGLFIDAKNAGAFRRRYAELIGEDILFSELSYQKKMLILHVSLASELHMLTHQLDRLAQKNRKSRDFTFNILRRALREVMACFSVYRTYIADGQVSETDRRYIDAAVRRATVRNPLLGRRVFRFIRDMLLLEYPPSFSEEERAEQRLFAGKFQQVTSPVAAKGIEDTALYVDNRLTSLNEVGGQPDVFGVSINALHKFNANRQERWPFALSPLSTHDTKRSEDVRARLNVLSEIPDEWWSAVLRWREMNAPLRRPVDDLVAPDVNEEYLFYQAILGAWPLEPYGGDEYRAFVERIQAYMTKALHEAKIHTSWINPNEEYDQAVAGFVADIFDEARSGPFLDDFARFRRRVVHFGLFNSLAQTLLKIASPGVADTYQGSEIWDFSLVDPDNRRPVDYEFRARMLADLKAASAGGQDLRQLARDLVRTKEDGRIKLYVHYQALQCCRAHPGLFNAGPYAPLLAEGQGGDHVFAFLRCHNDSCAVIAVPRLLVRLAADTAKPPLGAEVWGDTHLPLPETAARLHWRNLFTGEKVNASKMESATSLLIADVFRDFPVALLLGMP